MPSALQVIARILGRQGSGRLCIARLPRSAGGGVCGETALHHFLYRATPRAQFVMPAFSAPLNLPQLRQVGKLHHRAGHVPIITLASSPLT